MATIIVCDRCMGRIDANEGMTLDVKDLIRGMAGEKVLCGDCAGEFVWYMEQHRDTPPEAADGG